MPPRESLRPATNAEVDEYVRGQARRGEHSGRARGRTPIVEADIGWSDAPARRSRRRHPVADVDDWGGGAWVVESQPAPERSVAAREQARRERSERAARAGMAGDSEPERQLTDWAAWEPEDQPDGTVEAFAAEAPFGPLFDGEIIAARIDHAVIDGSSPAAAVTDGIEAARPPERRTIVITGRGAERQLPRGRSWEASLPLYERAGFRPDRLAMWAVLLGVILLLVAAASSHA